MARSPTIPPGRRLADLPALDGLRAVAVTLVLAYHLAPGAVPGGFLGVDLFFVISGFLITTLLLRERAATGRIALGAFWIRRFRRLVPLLLVVVAATVAATRAWGVPEQWSAVRLDAIGALAYVANWRFVFAEQSYFDTLLGPSPLLHTWSLGVEEQWYLLWPIAMIGLGALAVSRAGRRSVAVLLGGGIALSALLMAVWFDPVDPSRVYYGTDTRAQHLLVGAALAWLLHLRPGLLPTAHGHARFVAPAALCGFVTVAAVTADDAAWLYRGGLLGLSLLAAVVVWAVAVPPPRSPLGWLAWPVLVGIGRRSYGLYLWHWPVVVFVGPPIGLAWTGAPLVAAQVAVTVLLTEIGHRVVEVPARRPRPATIRPVVGWTAAAAATALVATTILTPPTGREMVTATVIRPDIPQPMAGDGARTRPDPVPSPAAGAPDGAGVTGVTGSGPETGSSAADAPAPSPDDPPGATGPAVTGDGIDPPAPSVPATSSATPDQTDAVPAPRADHPYTDEGIGTGAAEDPDRRPPERRVLILGDSTALVLALGLQDLQSAGWDVQSFSRLGCAITDGTTIDVGSDHPTRHHPDCAAWRTDWASAVELVRPDVVVVMIGAWEVLDHRVDGVDLRFPDAAWTAHVRSAVEDAADVASSTGASVAFATVPCMRQDPDSLVSTLARNDPARVDAVNAILTETASTMPDGHLLDLGGTLCPGGEYLEETGGSVVRNDGVHLTPEGVAMVWGWMAPQLDLLVGSANVVQ